MTDIAAWLEQLGLGKYAPIFSENEVELADLSELSEDDLKEIGLPLGPRRRILKAVRALDAGDRVPKESTGDDAADAHTRVEAERRQLTVMFCDLVGSTALSERLDPEDLREVIRAYQETCAGAVGRFDGHIAKYIGDGLLVYFGYPQAHEDDAQRAVRAGLDLVEGVAALNRRLGTQHAVELGVRVGIHTGLVVAGEMGGGETRESHAIVGETPNIAARLEALAEPGTVAISGATQRLVDGLFECDDLGRQRVKGISEPVAVYRILGESGAPSRFEVMAERGLPPLVGREEEIGLLIKRWEQAKDGEGQVVLLSGEAGVGKSRIVRGLRERLEGESYSRILYYGSAYHQNSAFYPAIDQLQRALRFARDDRAEQKLAKLETLLGDLDLPVAEHLPLHAHLISVPTDGRPPALELGPQQLKQKTIEAVVAIFEAMAVRTPVLMVVEDTHWVDPSTLELLDLLIRRLRSVGILLLLTFRPEFEPPWSGHAHLTMHALNRLSRRESARMVAQVTGGRAIPDEVLDQIVAKTDGVPLYLEELTKTVLESDLVAKEDGRYVLSGPLRELVIPASLQDSLMARLDRLGPVKEVAQLAAVIGRVFSYDLLAAVSPLDGTALENALAQLVDAELMFGGGQATDATYEFKHALVRDAAYQSLLKRRRKEFHGQVAQALKERFPEAVATEPELLAHHFTAAGLAEKALDYRLRAGERAASRSANMEAAEHLQMGLRLLHGLPAGEQREQRELLYLITLGPVLMATQGWGSEEVDRTYARAQYLAQKTGQPAVMYPAMWGAWLVAHASGRAELARELLEVVFELAHEGNEETLLLQAHHAGGSTMCSDGALRKAQEHIDAGIALYHRERHSDQAQRYGGHDPCVCAHSLGALNLLMLGYPEAAERFSRHALDLAPAVQHRPSIAHAHWYRAELSYIKGEPVEAAEHARITLEIAEPYGLGQYATWANMLIGWSRAVQGDAREGLEQVEQNLAQLRDLGIRYHFPHKLAVFAETLAAAGKIDAALHAVDEALASVQKTGEHWCEPEILRLKARLLSAADSSNRDQAATLLGRAMAKADEQEARLWELRAATSLARLWDEEGRRKEARELLAPVYGWFTEGFDTPDLKEANVLLEELS